MSGEERPALDDAAPLFVTPRLFARRIGPADEEDMLRVYGDEDAMRWVGDGTAITREEVVTWIGVTVDNYRNRGYGMVALVERESGTVVGYCGLVHPGGQSEAEIKYALKREYWGCGLATEAARGLLDYGRRLHGLRHVIATVAPDNLASQRVLSNAGMVRGRCEPDEDGSITQYFDWHAGD
jgi:RimJ/RimL family protein N-acetyltransferase